MIYLKLKMELRSYFRIVSLCLTFFLTFSSVNSRAKSFQEDLTLTLDQKYILDKFRNIVGPQLPHLYMYEDIYLMRWLRARNWNIVEAERFLMKNLKWRKENNIDQIQNEDWSDIEKDFPYWLAGRDKEGRPLLYLTAAGLDIRRIVISGKAARLLRYADKTYDEACGLVRELGEKYQNVSQGNIILNLEGFNLVQTGCLRCIPVLLNLVPSFENHYPGCVARIIFVNAPAIFEPILNAGRVLLEKETEKALMVFGLNKSVWKKVLAEYFNLDQLPPELGGTKLYAGMEEFDY